VLGRKLSSMDRGSGAAARFVVVAAARRPGCRRRSRPPRLRLPLRFTAQPKF